MAFKLSTCLSVKKELNKFMLLTFPGEKNFFYTMKNKFNIGDLNFCC